MFNNITSQQLQNAQQQENQKINLEQSLLIALLIFVNKLIPKIKANEQLYFLNNERLELQNILKKHYERVQKFFINAELKLLNVSLNDEELRKLKSILEYKGSLRASQQAGYILNTMQKELNELGKENLKVWENKTKTRIKSVIINTETQLMAEETKTEVINFLVNNSTTPIKSVMRTWITVGDDRVRLWHMAAQGQTQALGELFEVGPDKLRYPGDPRGQLNNILNCRCSLLTSIDFN